MFVSIVIFPDMRWFFCLLYSLTYLRQQGSKYIVMHYNFRSLQRRAQLHMRLRLSVALVHCIETAKDIAKLFPLLPPC